MEKRSIETKEGKNILKKRFTECPFYGKVSEEDCEDCAKENCAIKLRFNYEANLTGGLIWEEEILVVVNKWMTEEEITLAEEQLHNLFVDYGNRFDHNVICTCLNELYYFNKKRLYDHNLKKFFGVIPCMKCGYEWAFWKLAQRINNHLSQPKDFVPEEPSTYIDYQEEEKEEEKEPKIVRCKRCNKKLMLEESRERGYGAYCFSMVKQGL